MVIPTQNTCYEDMEIMPVKIHIDLTQYLFDNTCLHGVGDTVHISAEKHFSAYFLRLY